ncbi:MAG: hypothetical protein LBR72_04800 [Oscillospiraceae bacterium]|jgi:hypothetical protein|nr:hypothetical protein [Oscillospiraceae bacterium]
MALRIVDNQMQMTRPLDMAGDRARDIRQSGLQTGTIQDINRDTETVMQTVRDRPEVEEALVRTDAEGSDNTGGQEGRENREEELETPGDLRKAASERLLNLPISGKDYTSGGFDIKV